MSGVKRITVIDIGQQYERWCAVRVLQLQALMDHEDRFNADEITAKVLLDIYDAAFTEARGKLVKTSSIATQTDEETVSPAPVSPSRTEEDSPEDDSQSSKMVVDPSDDVVKKEPVVHAEYAIPGLSDSPPRIKVEPCDMDLHVEHIEPVESDDICDQLGIGNEELDSIRDGADNVTIQAAFKNQFAPSTSAGAGSETVFAHVQDVKPDDQQTDEIHGTEDTRAVLRKKNKAKSKRFQTAAKKNDSGNERQRRYKERRNSDPVKYARYLDIERQRYLKKKQKGVIKTVASMTEQERLRTRSKWREAKMAQRQRDRAKAGKD